MAAKVYKPEYPGLYYFDTFTFTTLGTSGNRGPDPTKGYADAPWRDGDFSIVDGQQQWTVPATGTYNIVAAGAYGATPGRVVSGDVDLSEGQVLTMLVGQQPTPLVANVADNVTVGGGGGTFVVSDGVPLIVASGGDGEAYSDNPWSQPVIVPFPSGSYAGITIFTDGTGTYFTRLEADYSFATIGSRLYEYDGTTWSSTFFFEGEICSYVNKVLGIAYSFTWLDDFTVRANDWVCTNGTWTKTTYMDLQLPLRGYPGSFNGTQVSGNGETLRILLYYSSDGWGMYKRVNNQWVYFTNFLSTFGGMSYDGNRLIQPNFNIYSQKIIQIYDYPWTSPPTEYLIPEPSMGNNNCTISPDGTLLVTYSNVYSLTDGSLVMSLPGYVYGPQSDLNISKDNKTIIKGFYGSDLQVLDYPFTQVNAVLSPVSAYSFYGSPFLSENGSVIIGNDILSGTSVYYKSFKSQSGQFLPSGTGGGDSGAGFYGDGSQTNPYFQFLVPTAYVNGGYGNSYEYGNKEEGGFGGGQSPLNKYNKLTKFTISSSPSTFSLGGNPRVVSVNSNATVMYYGTTRYLYSGGSWNYDQDFDYFGLIKGFLSVSDDGMTAVSYITQDVFYTPVNSSIGVVAGTQLYVVDGYKARVNKQGTRVAFSSAPGPNVYIWDAPFSGISNYKLILPSSFPLDSNVTSLDFSSDGSVLAIGFSVGNTGYSVDGALRILITRYPWTTYESINNVGNIVALSPDGQTLFAAVDSSDASFVYKYKYNQSQWQRVSRTSSGYKNIVYLATGSDGSLFVKPSDISLNFSGYPSLVFNFTAYNDDFSQVGSVSNSYVSNMSSDGQTLVNYNGSSLKFYTKQPITVNTLVNHGFPRVYQVRYELTANYNGIHDITVTSSNTFTFQGFSFANESGNLGAVAGVETGISGGGGYTGSAGDGVSGATCYADSTVANFTDLGAASNSAGYVTVSLVDPVPLQPTWSWDDESPWETINSFQSNAYTVTWCESLGLFVVGGKYTPLTVNISRDGKEWQQTNTTYYDNYQEPMVSATDKPVIVWGAKTSVDGLNWVENNKLYGFVVYCNGMFINSVNYDIYTSTDGFTWNIAAFSTLAYTVRAYGNNKYVGISSNGYGRIVYSGDLITWNYANSTGGEYGIQYTKDVSFGNGVFVSYNTNNDIYTSTDGISWTYQTFPNDFPGTIQHLSNLTFGGSIFLVVKEYVDNSHPVTTTSSYFYTSSHGDTWTKGVVALNYVGIISITYSPSLDFFIFLSQSAFPYLTLDGQYFVPGGNYFVPYNFTNIVYSPTSGVIVVGNYTSTDQGATWTLDKLIDPVDYDRGTTSYNVLSNDLFFKFMSYYNSSFVLNVRTYTSFDGLDWTYEGENDFELFGIPFWCQSRGYFIANGKYLSKDGVNWTLLGNQNMVVTAYSETLGLFTGYDSNDQYQQFNGQNYYSYDGYNWTLADESGINPISWSSSLKLFAGVKFMYYSYEENRPFFGIFVSSNGINWELSYLFSDATPRGVTWSPELEKFFVYLPGKSNDPSYFYDKFIESSDGYNWSTVQLSTTSNPNYWKDTFAWVSGLDRFVLSHDELVSIRVLFSTKAIKQF